MYVLVKYTCHDNNTQLSQSIVVMYINGWRQSLTRVYNSKQVSWRTEFKIVCSGFWFQIFDGFRVEKIMPKCFLKSVRNYSSGSFSGEQGMCFNFSEIDKSFC